MSLRSVFAKTTPDRGASKDDLWSIAFGDGPSNLSYWVFNRPFEVDESGPVVKRTQPMN